MYRHTGIIHFQVLEARNGEIFGRSNAEKRTRPAREPSRRSPEPAAQSLCQTDFPKITGLKIRWDPLQCRSL